jgi:transcriptional regulator with XRE-family HTH domain
MDAQTLRSIRASLNLNQTEFGRLVGRGQQAMSDLEQGRRPIDRTLALAVRAVEAGIRDA